jgi:hypothetical protein
MEEVLEVCILRIHIMIEEEVDIRRIDIMMEVDIQRINIIMEVEWLQT